MSKRLNLIGQTFGMLTVTKLVGTRGGHTLWECACECGSTTTVTGGKLTHGWTRSCGCLRSVVCSKIGKTNVKHGMESEPTYGVWTQMMQRCYLPSCPAFKDYGARGIKVAVAWHDVREFIRDMGERPEGMTLDRIDNDGNYEPSNCRWATRLQQNNNTRANRRITVFGKTQTLMQWSRETGIKRQTIAARIDRGLKPEVALGGAEVQS